MTNRTVAVRLLAITSAFSTSMRHAGKDVEEVRREVEKADAQTKKTGRNLEGVGRGMMLVGGAALAGAAIAVKSFATFDKAMSGVSAATHETAENMDALREAALQAGADTAFSATEAAAGIEALAKAGVVTKDVLGGGLAGALDLAAAGTLEVGEAAEIAATALTQFKLDGADVPHVADLLAAAAGKAQGEVTDMGMALKQGGLVASQMGLSIEETTGTLAAFASAGLIGSDAGTSLKTMLLQLANPSKDSAKLMRTLGIEAYDAAGKFVGIEDLAGQLKTELSDLTQAQRDSALATIFGSDAIRAASILYTQGARGVQEWTTKVDDAGYAAETAATKMDNLSGDLEALKGSIETALIGAGSSANGVLRDMTQAATGVTNAYIGLPPGAQSAATAITGVGGALTLASGAFVYAVPKVAAFRESLSTMGPGAQRFGRGLGATAGILAGPWGLALAGGVVALGAIAKAHGEAKARVDDLTAAIEADTGALGDNTRAAVVNQLQRAGSLKAAREFAVSVQDVTDAALGDEAAQKRVNVQLQEYVTRTDTANGAAGRFGGVVGSDTRAKVDALRRSLGTTNDELREAQDQFALTKEALSGLDDRTIRVRVQGGQAAIDTISRLRYEMMGVEPSVTVGVLNKLNGSRASGGYTPPGTYLVGERGPELFTTAVSGSIVPAGPTAGFLAAGASGAMFTAASPTVVRVEAGGSGAGQMMGDLIIHNPRPERASDDIPRMLDAQRFRLGR